MEGGVEEVPVPIPPFGPPDVLPQDLPDAVHRLLLSNHPILPLLLQQHVPPVIYVHRRANVRCHTRRVAHVPQARFAVHHAVSPIHVKILPPVQYQDGCRELPVPPAVRSWSAVALRHVSLRIHV